MKKHQPKYILAVALGLSLLRSVAPAQSLGRAPSATDHPGSKRQQGFTDYALGKINSDNHDYGSDLQSARREFIVNTVDDAYFWSNCVTLGLLVAVTGCYFLQLRSSDKKERIAATLIAQMWNGRVSDKVEIDKRTAAYNTLVDQHNEMIDQTLSGRRTSGPKRASESAKGQEGSGSVAVVASKETDISDVQAASSTQPMAGSTVPKEEVAAAPVAPASDIDAPDSSAAQKTTPRIDQIECDPMALKQEVIRLRAQVGAFKNRENNLLVRLNAAEEYKKQSNSISR